MDDGWMPCCRECGEPYKDGEIGEVKNYPDDGLVTIFFTCENCRVESQFIYQPYKSEEYMGEG